MDQTRVSGNHSVDLLNENNCLNHVNVVVGDDNLGQKSETLEVGLNLNLNDDSVNLLNENNCLNVSVGDEILGEKVVVSEGFVETLEVGENCDLSNRINLRDGVSLNHDSANLMNDSCLNCGGDGILGKNAVEALESKLGIGENCEVNRNDGVNLNNDSADLLKNGCSNHGGEEILGKNVMGSEGFEETPGMELDNVTMNRNGVDFDSNIRLNLNDGVNSNPTSGNSEGFAESLEPELGVGENCKDNRNRVDFDSDMGFNLNDGIDLNHDSANMLSNSCLNHGGDEIGEKNVRGSERFTKILEVELGPNKRRRFEIRGDSGNDSANLLNYNRLNRDGGEIEGKNGFEKILERELGVSEKCNDDVSVNKNRDLNLNDGFNSNHELDLNVGLDLNAGTNVLEHGNDNSKEGKFIDLNLDANANEEDDTILKADDTQKKEHCFDLNLGLDDETRNLDADCDGQLKKITNPKSDEEIQVKEIGGNAKGVHYEIVSKNPVKGSTSSNENLLGDVFQKEDSYSPGSFKRKGIFGVLAANSINDSCSIEIQLKSPGTMATPEYQGNLGSVHIGSNSTKRRKLSNSVKSSPKTVLRRSTRAGRATFSAQIHDSGSMSDAMTDELSSPSVSVVSEEKLIGSGHEKSEEHNDVPPKLQLPPSSENLNLDGIPILELFSVYSFLRSFSTILFLSPFELEDFVAALRSKTPNLLIDFIHVCLLRILRKHLEFLSDESSQSASLCLRSLNWDLLDLITWPVYLVEYVLMHSSGLESDINISHLKFFGTEYYEQPESVKIEILQSLCDDVIEVEAIKSELNRRMLGTEGSMDVDRNVKFDSSKKKKHVMDVPGGPCLTDEFVEETTDWNSDECCLCKMDGNLICCDGCPAAFHAKCVGVATNLLPEGDWYCPECVLDKDRPWLRVGKAIRGAELLGFDPHGRLYYSSCGYLLVLDSCDTESLYKYYHRNDLTVVIEALKSSDLYSPILSAITKLCNATVIVNGTKSSMLQLLSVPSGTFLKDETTIEGKPKENMISTYSSSIECGIFELPKIDAMNVNQSMKIEKSLANSEGSAEISQVISTTQNFQKTSPNCLIRSSGILNDSAIPGMCTLSMRYVNYYSFARIASSVAEELTRKFSNKTPDKPIRSIEEILSTQMKVISNLSTEFCWSNIENLNVDARKERCGWCFSCQVPDDDRDCLFIINDTGPVHDGFTSELLGIGSKNNRKGHLIDVMCHILCIEDRLRGLLLGPWLNPHYSKIWRKNVLKASDITSVKQLLLMLESNLRPLALSAEWPKHVDTAATMGSASYVVTRMSTKLGTSQKRARCSDLEPSSSSKAVSGLGLFWWRGGSLSRQLFSWKVLPRSLVSKAARQGGCKKIPGILYPDSSEFTKRSKNVAWRASVETSRSADQLALQVREFDANIRWDDIENTSLLSKMDKESRKPTRSFKKVIVRKKCTEGTMVKYLLDFGKKRFIPDIVLKQGSKIEESSNEKKKYWLEECYVPLHLLKGFEDRRIARKSNKASSGKLHEIGRVIKKPSSKRGFSYLFSKAERSENFKCGHCNKDVLIREAVSCQYCKGFFHKRHVKKSAGAITAKCTYTCHKCHGGKWSKVDTKKGKSQLEKIGNKKGKSQLQKKKKKVSKTLSQFRAKIAKKLIKEKQPEQPHSEEKDLILPLRRSSRKVKHVPILNKIIGGDKQENQSKSRKGLSEKPNTGTRQKKRTLVYHSYWLNGLQLSRKPNDERGMDFRREKIITPSEESTVILEQPKCGLCRETEFKSTLTYIQCEICGDWFHGDAFGLRDENIGNLIGFKCHMCRNRTPPVCSHFHTTRRSVALSRRSRK